MNLSYKLTVLAALLSAAACANDGSLAPDGNDDQDVADGGPSKPPPGRPDAGVDGGGRPTPGDAGATCGNGARDEGEACDDGNASDADGCSSTCQLESAVEGDACPGREIVLTQLGTNLRGSASGTTVGAYNQYGSACGGGSGADVVYSFTPTTSGKAVVRFGADYLGILSARATCGDTSSESACSALMESGTERTFEFPVFAGTPAFLFVDGYAGGAGAYDIEVDISLAACGNGVAELPERCDDGNTTDGDGCSSTCAFETGGILNRCPGQPIFLAGAPGAPRVVSFTGNTLTDGASNALATGCYFGDGAEVIYALQSDIDGSARVELTAGYQRSAVHVRRECTTGNGYQTDCAVREAPGETSLDVSVKAGEWFYVFVDSWKGSGGPFTATVTITPGACGNGSLDGAEECDDANTAAGDGCNETCRLEPNAATNTCAGAPITLAPVGDGSLRGLVSGTTVGSMQKVPPCNGGTTDTYVNTPQVPSSSMAGDAIYTVVPSIDGNLEVVLHDIHQGVVSILSDAPCTLRPSINGSGRLPNVLACSHNGWSPSSTNDSPYILDGLSGDKRARSAVRAGRTYFVVVDSFVSKTNNSGEGPYTLDLTVRPPVCGNGVLDGAEACDDGNLLSGDGCDAACAIESDLGDTCATAKPIAFAPSGDPGTFAATTRGSTKHVTGNQDFTNIPVCSAPGPDVYYRLKAPAAGVLRITAQSAAFDVVLGVRDVCATNTRPLACSNGGGIGSEESIQRAVALDEEILVVVDSPGIPAVAFCTGTPAAGCEDLINRGLFQLDATIAPSVCGDGFFATGSTEQCDDGNTVSGDGCSATCTVEPLPGVDTCPGYVVPLAVGTDGKYSKVIAVTTNTLSSNYSGACGGNGPDGVLRVVAPITGTMTARATNLDGVTVYARNVCNDPATEFFKRSATGTTLCPSTLVHEEVSFPVTATDEYFVFVDGLNGVSGVPTVEITVTP